MCTRILWIWFLVLRDLTCNVNINFIKLPTLSLHQIRRNEKHRTLNFSVLVLNQNWNKQWSCPKIFDTNLFLKRTISNTISYITLKDTINNEWLFWKMMLNIMNPPVWYKYNITRKDDARNAIFCLHDQIHTSTNNKLVLQLPFSAWNPFKKRLSIITTRFVCS